MINYKKYLVVFISIVFVIIFIGFIDNNYSSVEKTLSLVNNDNSNKNKFEYIDSTLDINYSTLTTSLNFVNKYLNSVSINLALNNMVNSYDEVKMYNKNDGKVLEVSLEEEEINNILDRETISDNVIVKLSFSEEDINSDIESIDYEINKEEIIRSNIVKTAVSQINSTGETYWQWYGFNWRVEWCAVFVSWVAAQNNVLETDVPKFVWVKKGVDYFKEKNELKFPKSYTPRGGDIIFFNWNNNEVIDHVGIVEKVQNGYVYTIEGNVDYKDVKRKKYKLNNNVIYAYGVPEYSV